MISYAVAILFALITTSLALPVTDGALPAVETRVVRSPHANPHHHGGDCEPHGGGFGGLGGFGPGAGASADAAANAAAGAGGFGGLGGPFGPPVLVPVGGGGGGSSSNAQASANAGSSAFGK